MRATKVLPIAFAMILPIGTFCQDAAKKADARAYLTELSRLGARKPFTKDSPDVYLEPASLGQFFTDPIYKRLAGNAYFGYRYDEGFAFEGNEIQIETIRDLTPGAGCAAGYRLALGSALEAAGIQVKPSAAYQIGICIVGIEARETDSTLPGAMVEAYLRNSRQKKSFFIRYGAGSSRSLAAAIRLSAEMLVSELQGRWKGHELSGTR